MLILAFPCRLPGDSVTDHITNTNGLDSPIFFPARKLPFPMTAKNSFYRGTAYRIRGASNLPTVTLIHGLGLNHCLWQWHEPALSANFRILSYDLFGHGNSAPPPGPPSLGLFARQLYDLLDHLRIRRCAMIGFSLGGMINRRFAIDHPERVNALAVLNSPHERHPEAQRIVEQRAQQSVQRGPAANLDETIARWFTADFIASRPDIIDTVRRWVLSNDPHSYARCRQVLAKGVTEIIRPEPPIVTPTLVMTAENDSGSTPAMSHAIASEMPNAQTVIVPRLQHMALVESPARFVAPVLTFLKRTLDGCKPRETDQH